ncbi:hypothetical protein OAM32_03540 [Alphaproteobacteria bacterium]|nr:hypothetical protein [Alphaproteobacteria bacterium]
MKDYRYDYNVVDGLIFDEDFLNAKTSIDKFLYSDGGIKNIFLDAGCEEDTRLTFEDNLFHTELSHFLGSESYKNITEYVSSLLESDEVFMFLPRVIITVNRGNIPNWILEKLLQKSNQSAVLTKYVKKKFRRCFFFLENPLHQDWIDLPDSHSDFLTCLIPLTKRDEYNAPLYIAKENLTQSEKLIKPPFKSVKYTKDYTVFENNEQSRVKLQLERIVPNVGSTIFWGSRVFHEVRQNMGNEPVINLRFNFSHKKKGLGLDDERNIFKF